PKAPSAGAPPVPGGAGNRLRSNSDGRRGRQSGDDSGGLPSAPQLGGIFAGGMPKLRKRGGIDTGANPDSSYLSDSESSRNSAPLPPTGSAPRPPATPKVPAVRLPVLSSTDNLAQPPINPLVANLRKV